MKIVYRKMKQKGEYSRIYICILSFYAYETNPCNWTLWKQGEQKLNSFKNKN